MSDDLPDFDVRVESGELDHLIVVEGELDVATVPKLERCLDDVIEKATGNVVVDLAEVDYVDSTGLRVLLSARDRLAPAHRSFALVNPSVEVSRLLEICGVRHLVAPTVEPAGDGDSSSNPTMMTDSQSGLE